MEQPEPPKRVASPEVGLRWKAAVRAARNQSEQGPFDFRPETYSSKWDRLEKLTIAMTAQTLMELGILKRPANPLPWMKLSKTAPSGQSTEICWAAGWFVWCVRGALRMDNGGFVNTGSLANWAAAPHMELVPREFRGSTAVLRLCGALRQHAARAF